jgi:hypothetical protein
MQIHTSIQAIALVACIASCTTIQSTATQAPDGTKGLQQRVTVFAGGKLHDGMLDFRAVAGPDAWQVESGTTAEGATSPNTIRDLSELLRSVAEMQALAAQMAWGAEPEPSPVTIDASVLPKGQRHE